MLPNYGWTLVALGTRGDTPYVTPPNRVELLPIRGTNGFEKGQFLIRPLPDANGSALVRGGPAFWRPESNSKVDLAWTDGFTGVTLKMEKRGDPLVGWAHPHFDSPQFMPRVAHVMAHKISCPPSN